MVVDGTKCLIVGRHGMIRKYAPHDLPKPAPLLWDWLMHPLPQFPFDLPKLDPHAIASALSTQKIPALARFTADVGEAQEVEGFRLSEPALRASFRRMAAKLDQAGLIRMQRQRELL